MKISIFGTGYVGLVTGTCFAELGNNVMCCDIDEDKIKILKSGKAPFYEPGLEEMILGNVKANRLLFTTDLQEAVHFGDFLFIAVGTPPKNHGEVDLSYVLDAASSIGENLNKDGKIIINKSTVPVGTALEVKNTIFKKLQERNIDFDFAVVSNPEFLKEGDAINDFMKPDRVVIGVDKDWARKKMEELYGPLITNGHPIYFLDTPSAEMSKYAANAMLAAKISFINQIANLCEITGADVEAVRKVICADQRIGPYYLYPGIGYGGSCLSKDVQALSALAKKFGYKARLIETIEMVNKEQKQRMAKKVIRELGNLESKKIAVWGLSFRFNTDDMRDAPSIDIIEALLSKGAKVIAYDPKALDGAKKIFSRRIEYSQDMYECLRGAEALILITEWPQFKEPDFNKIKGLLKNPIIFDGRNIYSPSLMKELGFKYISIGRPALI